MSRENSENKAKKVWYKKWWVWLIVGFALLVVLGNIGDSENITDADGNITVFVYKVNKENEREEIKVKKGDVLEIPFTPERKGYAFSHWSLNPDSDEIFDFNTPITKTISLYAKWIKKQVQLIDFSKMAYDDIVAWCKENNVECGKKTEYSDTIAKDDFIKQSIDSGGKIDEGDKVVIVYSLGKAPTVSQRNAEKKAKEYLDIMSFSRKGLIKQLEYEGFDKADAIYGVDNVTVDWEEQAVKKAQSYLDTMSFSRKGLIEQLEYEGFTKEQATHGANEVGL